MLSKTLRLGLEWITTRVHQRRQIAPETTFLFAEIARDWKLLWRYASPAQKAEIISCGRSVAGQRAFATELASWAKERWPDHPQVSQALLFQLSDEEPFSTWSNLRHEFVDKHPAAYGVAVPGNDTGRRDHIWRMPVWLAPKLDGEPESVLAIPLNFETQDSAARNAAGDVIRAIQSTLIGLTRRCFLKWFVQYGWKQLPLAKEIILITLSTNLLLLVLLTILPDSFLKSDLIVALGIQVAIVVAAAMIAAFVYAIVRQYRSAIKDSQTWRQLLERSRVLMAISSPQQPPINGASFGITLAVSLLLSLDKSIPAKSAFFTQAIVRLRESANCCVFSGCVSADGSFGSVKYLPEKLKAAIDFNAETGQPLKVFVQPKENILEESAPVSDWRLPSTNAEKICLHAGSPGPTLELRSYGCLTDLLFEAGTPAKYIPGSLLLIACACFAFLALWAGLFNLSRIIDPPSVPKASMTLSPVDSEARASLTIYSSASDQFAARVRSGYWQSCLLKRFPVPDGLDNSATIGFTLTKSPYVQAGSHPGQGTVEIVRLRSVLWRNLPPAEKRSVATFGELIDSGPPFHQ